MKREFNPGCLIAKDKPSAGVWRCAHDHLHLDLKTILESKGYEATQENMDQLRAALQKQLPETNLIDC